MEIVEMTAKKQRFYKMIAAHLIEILIIFASTFITSIQLSSTGYLCLILGHFIFHRVTKLNLILNYYFNKNHYLQLFFYSLLHSVLLFFISKEDVFKNYLSYLVTIFLVQILYREFILKIRFEKGMDQKKGKKNVLIIGAGNAGEQIIREINDRGIGYNLIGILDDSEQKQGKRIHGVKIMGKTSELNNFLAKFEVDQVLICIPSADSIELDRIYKECVASGVSPKVLPDSFHVLENKVRVTQLREIDIEDILTRKKITHDVEKISAYFTDKHVFVTGGAGSIGSELCFQAIKMGCKELTIVDNNEYGLYSIDIRMKELFPTKKINTYVLDIRNYERLNSMLGKLKPDIVYHAAAYKHVPLMEGNPMEAIENNIKGTKNVLSAIRENGIKQFVLVSTDKAVNPTNIMGATKRVCEILTLKEDTPNTAKSIVRFGNVLNSKGSVIPRFEKQIKNGGPVTLTHKDIIRYFMSIPEAAQLLLLCATLKRNNEIFVLDMGKPVRIYELAEKLIRIHGLVPNDDIKIEYTGLRPGEKLYEELLADNETTVPTDIEKIRVAKLVDTNNITLREIDNFLGEYTKMNALEIKSSLQKIIPEYSPVTE